jgi:hypothetical protein
MKEKSISVLRRRRKTLIKKLPPFEAVLRGSLIERYKRCGKPGCKCAQTRGHGPKYYLSVSKPKQKPEMDYIPLDYQAQVVEYINNFRHIKTILEELCEINRELIKRREKL